MSSRLAFESWQLVFPAIGIAIFFVIFVGAVVRVWRMQRPSVDRLSTMPLEEEMFRPSVAGLGEAGPGSSTPATIQPSSSAAHGR